MQEKIWYDNGDGTLSLKVKVTGVDLSHDVGATVLPVANGGTNITSFTAGDLLYATGATTLAKLAKGTDGQVLTMVSGAPAWADLP